MALETDFELTEVLLIVVAVGAIGYFAYKGLTKAANAAQDSARAAIDNTTSFFDDLSGASSAPGGVGSNTYTNALGQTFRDPVGVFKSILGW